jgi:hypothetical protein
MKMLPLLALMLASAPVLAGPPMIVKGELAYTDVLRYDYTGDGKRNRVRFWLAFDGHSAIGKEGEPGYEPASGTMRYFLRDDDDGTKVLKWRGGLDMLGLPKDTPMQMTDLRFEGKTVRFEAYGMQWTLVDGGRGYASDQVIVNDGFRTSEIKKLYAGDLWIGPAE